MDRATIVEVFRQRIAAVVSAARAHLDALPERAELPVYEEYAAGVGMPRDEYEASLQARVDDALRREEMGMPGRRFISRLGRQYGEMMPPASMPETYGAAVAYAERESGRLAEELAGDVLLLIDELIAPDLRGEVLAGAEELASKWPIWSRSSSDHGTWDAVLRVTSRDRPWPRAPLPDIGVEPIVVAEWARAGVNALHARTAPKGQTPAGDELVENTSAHGPITMSWGGGRYRVEAAGLILLYAAERDARWRVQPRYAAGLVVDLARTLPDSSRPDESTYAALRHALQQGLADGTPDPVAAYVEGIEQSATYAGKLLSEAVRLIRQLFPADAPAPASDDEAIALADSLGSRFADALAALGSTGKEAAEAVRKSEARRMRAALDGAPAGARWALWLDPTDDKPPRWLRTLARVLWCDRWRSAVARVVRPVALPAATTSAIERALTASDVAPGSDGGSVLVDGHGRVVARYGAGPLTTAIDAEVLDRIARQGVAKLTSIASARFVTWFAERVQRREDERAPLEFFGSAAGNAFATIAAEMGMNPDKSAGEIRVILHAMQRTVIEYPDGGVAGLLLFDHDPGGGRGRPSRVTITPGRPWRSDDVHSLPKSGEYRALAPLPRLDGYVPTFVGAPSDWAGMARLWLGTMSWFAYNSIDLAHGLGVYIPPDQWRALAREAGAVRAAELLIPLLPDRWTRDGDDGAAILERVGPDRFHLAPRFKAERALLEAGGKLRIEASKRGMKASRRGRGSR